MTLTRCFTRNLGGFINKTRHLSTFSVYFTPQTATAIDIRIYLL